MIFISVIYKWVIETIMIVRKVCLRDFLLKLAQVFFAKLRDDCYKFFFIFIILRFIKVVADVECVGCRLLLGLLGTEH
jgi:hypothetical protein